HLGKIQSAHLGSIRPALTARPGLPHRRAGECMRPAIHSATARQNSDEPLPVVAQVGDRNNREPCPDMAAESAIAGLAERSTHELRLAWRRLYRKEPPVGLSRDLMIRALANKLQERAHGGPSLALRRRLQTLTGELEKNSPFFNPGITLRSGVTLVRQWRGRTHTVLVRDDGFEYEGERYRSLSVIAGRI